MSNLVRRMLSTSTAPTARDPEQGEIEDTSKAPEGIPTSENTTSEKITPNGRPLTVRKYEPGALVPTEDRLLIFRTLTGIDTVPVVARNGHAVRSGPNIGIYTRVLEFESSAKRMYTIVKALSSLCLALQIIMGAAVTALGAAGGSYSGITGLGAVSTVTASIVAYVKGTGQPQKLKYIESRWKWVREHIEQREREICLADCPLDVYNEVRIVEEMYHAVKEEIEADKNNSGQQSGPPGPGAATRTSVGGISGAMAGSPAAGRRRSEIVSFDGHEDSKETGGKSVGRSDSTTFRPDSTADKLPKES